MISQVWSRNTTLTWFCHCYAPNAWTSTFQLKCFGEFFSIPATLFVIAELPGSSIARMLCCVSSQDIKSSHDKTDSSNGDSMDGRRTVALQSVYGADQLVECSRFSVYIGPNWYLRRVCNFSSSWHFTKFLDSSADFGRSKKIRDIEITGNKFLGWPAVQTPAPKLLLYNSLSVYNLLVDTTDLYMNQPLVTIFKKVITNFSGLQSPKIEACERFFFVNHKKK